MLKSKRLGKYLAVVLSVIMLLSVFPLAMLTVSADATAIVVDTRSVERGSEASVNISLSGNPGVSSIKLFVAFPDELTLKSVKYNTAEMGGIATKVNDFKSPITLNWINYFYDYSGDGVFATLTFKVDESATLGDKDIIVCYNQDDVYNTDDNNVVFEVQNGVITVTGCDHLNTVIREKTTPTCTEAGYTGNTYCADCGKLLSNGEGITPLGHVGGTGTCCGLAVCTRCGVAYGDYNVNNHTGGTEVRNARAATCVTDGNTGDTYCLGCNIRLSKGDVIPATGHNYNAVVTEPNETEMGYTTHTCRNCGDVYVDEYTDPLGASHLPGDINGDGKTNNKDLTRLFRYLTDWDVEVNELALDITGDGYVNNQDLVRLFRYLSDWDVVIY